MKFKLKHRNLSTSQIILFGFLIAVLIGTLLLMLPVSTKGSGGASFMDALFTATSAVCVTGLIVHDTATYWSAFGHFIIMLLIQIGGMGVVTIALTVTVFSGRKIGLMQRSTMQESISAPQMGGIVKLTGFIFRTTLVIELIGALIMAPVFCKDFGILKGICYAVFHSVSAFCNAGFDLMGIREPYSSLTSYSANPVINLTVMLLIIVGGIGFLTWDDIRKNGIHFRRYRMQSKVIITVTLLLIILPFIYFYFCEYSKWDGLSFSDKLWASAFQAVTPRTAGFNTTDLNMLSEPGKMVTVILILIGGSPGSTAGGMKTTTIAVLLFSAAAVFMRRESAKCFDRRIPNETIKFAGTILIMYLILLLTGGIFISYIEGLPLLPCIFEAGSAIGTVGLTLGITPDLCLASKILLTFLMFMGRVGGLTIVFAAVSGTRANIVKLPQEKITVG